MEDGRVRMNVYIDAGVLRMLDYYAKASNRNRSQAVNALLFEVIHESLFWLEDDSDEMESHEFWRKVYNGDITYEDCPARMM